MNRGLMMALLSLSLVTMVFSGFMVWRRVQTHFFAESAESFRNRTMDSKPDKIAGATSPSQTAEPVAAEQPRAETAKPVSPTPAKQHETAKPKPVPAPKKEPPQKPEKKTPAHAKSKTPKPAKAVTRNVLFQYRDSIPKTVSVAGDFNDWDPEPMTKSKNHTWTLSLQLEPGDYAYNFVVDGRLIRDPSNRKSKSAGQRIPSSLITVK